LKQAVIDFIEHQDYEKAYKQLTSSDYVWNFLSNKNKQQQMNVKEHVGLYHKKKNCASYYLFVQYSSDRSLFGDVP
jgi:hypothetical protein